MKITSTPIVIFNCKSLINKNNQDYLTGFSDFIITSFNANFNFRFKGEPYMEMSFQEGRKESIAGHMWGAAITWYALKHKCKNLAKLVNSEKVFEILLFHDLGEILRGDTPIYEKFLNEKIDNKQIEREDLQVIIKDFPKEVQERMLYHFDQFEDAIKSSDLEILVARLIDSLHGSFFVFAQGNDLVELTDLRNKLTKKHFGGIVGRIFEILDRMGEKEAREEVAMILEDHIKLWKRIGVEIKHDSYFS